MRDNLVRLTTSGLKRDIEAGMTRKDLSSKYGISVGQINKALKAAGLSNMRASIVKFALVDEEPEQIDTVPSSIVETEEAVQQTLPSMPLSY